MESRRLPKIRIKRYYNERKAVATCSSYVVSSPIYINPFPLWILLSTSFLVCHLAFMAVAPSEQAAATLAHVEPATRLVATGTIVHVRQLVPRRRPFLSLLVLGKFAA